MAGRSHFDKKEKNVTNIINFNYLSFKYHVTQTKIVKSLLFCDTQAQNVIYGKTCYFQ